MLKTQQGLRPIKLGVCAFIMGAAIMSVPVRVQSVSETPMRFGGVGVESLDRAAVGHSSPGGQLAGSVGEKEVEPRPLSP